MAERAGTFAPGAIDLVKGRSELAVMWLEHLLLLSMLQHASGSWSWGRYVVVHPAANSDVAGLVDRYGGLLANDATYSSMTIEDLLGSGALPTATTRALRERYLPA